MNCFERFNLIIFELRRKIITNFIYCKEILIKKETPYS